MFWIIGIGYVLIGIFKASAHLESGLVGAKGPTVTFWAVTLLWPLLLKGQGGAVLFWIIVIAVIYFVGSSEKNSPAAVAENAPVMASKPETKSSVSAPVSPSIATGITGGASSQGDQVSERKSLPYENPTAQIVSPPSPTNSPESSPEQRYANLVAEMERKGQYSGDNPNARCEKKIPRKDLPDRAAWVQLLRDNSDDEQKALPNLIKIQCGNSY
jgi:hypothetical protein